MADAGAVFAREGAAHPQGLVEDGVDRRLDPLPFLVVSRLSVRIVGCRLPSPAWPKVPMVQIVLVCDLLRWPATISGIRLRGTVASSSTRVGLSLARADRAAAAGRPDPVPLGVIPGDTDGGGPHLSGKSPPP